jgi:hypothetical protein
VWCEAVSGKKLNACFKVKEGRGLDGVWECGSVRGVVIHGERMYVAKIVN